MEPLSPPLSPNLSPTASPYITAPSSPKNPANSASDDAPDFEIELKPFDGNDNEHENDYQDITFEFCVDHFQSFSLPAEELFDGGKIRTLKPLPAAQPERANSPPLSIQNVPQTKRKIIWSSRRSYDFSETLRTERGTTTSFEGGSKTSRFSRLRNLLSFRRPLSSERGSTSSKASTSFGSTGSSSSGSVSGWGVRYLSGSVREPDEGFGVARHEVKSCLTPCKQRLLSCFVKKL